MTLLISFLLCELIKPSPVSYCNLCNKLILSLYLSTAAFRANVSVRKGTDRSSFLVSKTSLFSISSQARSIYIPFAPARAEEAL